MLCAMSRTAKIGEIAVVGFGLYEADGITRVSGAAGRVTVELWLSDRAGNEDLVYLSVEGAAADPDVINVQIVETPRNDYIALVDLTQADPCDLRLVVRDAVSGVELTEAIQVFNADLDTVLAAVSSGGSDVVVDITGVDSVRVGDTWSPVVRFRRKSTMALFDPDPLVSVVVLAGNGVAVLQTVAGADFTRTSIGRYSEELDAPTAAGTVFLRVRFRMDGEASAEDDFVDVKAIQVLPALADQEVASGATAKLEHIYTCPTFLEDVGYDLTTLSVRQMWSIIRSVSRIIDEMTTQWFNADYGVWDLEGRGRPLAMHSTDIPIVFVEQVEVDGDRVNEALMRSRGLDNTYWQASGIETGLQVIAATEYVNRGRQLERIRSDWPSGPLCLRLTGALGWIEGVKNLETVSTTEFSADSTYIDVEDATGFQVRDVVDVVGELDAARVILTGVSRSLNRLYFNAKGEPTDPIEEGAVVRSFGQVPGGIEEVANYLFGVVRRERAANVNGQAPVEPGRVKREETDDYAIEFFGSQAAASGAMTTGSPKYDAILIGFSPPARIRVV